MPRVLLATGDRFGVLETEAGEEIEWSLDHDGLRDGGTLHPRLPASQGGLSEWRGY